MNDNVLLEVPTFTFNGQTLSLFEIAKQHITSITVSYLSKEKKIKADGIRGLFGHKKIKQEEREITITDQKGITLYAVENNELAVIRFWDKKQFDQLSNNDFDENTLQKRYVMTIIQPYQINFHIGNIKSVNWK